jgi:hypothetical protein
MITTTARTDLHRDVLKLIITNIALGEVISFHPFFSFAIIPFVSLMHVNVFVIHVDVILGGVVVAGSLLVSGKFPLFPLKVVAAVADKLLGKLSGCPVMLKALEVWVDVASLSSCE